MKRFAQLLLLFALALLFGGSALHPAGAHRASTGGDAAPAALAAVLAARGELRLVVGIDAGDHPDPAAVAAAQTALLTRLAQHRLSAVTRFVHTPGLALGVNSLAALRALAADPAVTLLQEDLPAAPLLDGVLPQVRAPEAHLLGYSGAGWAVAVLDSGVDKGHPALAGKVVAEACFSSYSGTSTSLCPGGVIQSVALGAGAACPAGVSGCDHGTHSAAVMAGIAPDASIISIQVFSRAVDDAAYHPCADSNRPSPCTVSFVSDQIRALDHVLELAASRPIAAVNLGLGSGEVSGACAADLRAAAIAQLRDLYGIATVVAAGNHGATGAMSAPACVPQAVSVAATGPDDRLASYSNLSDQTTLLAPGTAVDAAAPGGGYQVKTGTSQAAPQAVGALAVLRQAAPAAAVDALIEALATSGPLVADTRPGGTLAKHRLDLYAALCRVAACDDDFGSLQPGIARAGRLDGGEIDQHWLPGTAGDRVTVTVQRTTGTLDPYLTIYDPEGQRVARNENGSADRAGVTGYLLRASGRYRVVVGSHSGQVGTYLLEVTAAPGEVAAVPAITRFYPAATGAAAGGTFWLEVQGRNFGPTSELLWNEQPLPRLYLDPTRLWAQAPAGALAAPWPYTVTLQVRNPVADGVTPGPVSPAQSFRVSAPGLGPARLLAPAPGAAVPTGVSTTWVLSWTAPLTLNPPGWRGLQTLELRLRTPDHRRGLAVRLVERGAESAFHLLDNADPALPVSGTVESGLPAARLAGRPGEPRALVLTDTVRLHLAASRFAGAGRTLVVSPTLEFSPAAAGVYNVSARVEGPDGAVQEQVLGQITLARPECPVPVTGVSLSGPAQAFTGSDQIFAAQAGPSDASEPITYTWTPAPASGQGSAVAHYVWPRPGHDSVFVQAANCGGLAAARAEVAVAAASGVDLVVAKSAPPVARAGEIITYTLTVTNQGTQTTTTILVTDTVPAGAAYERGGIPVAGSVRWTIPALGPFGASAQVSYTASIGAGLVNDDYGARIGPRSAPPGTPAVTALVDDYAQLTPFQAVQLASGEGERLVQVDLAAGSVAEAHTVALARLDELTRSGLSPLRFAGTAFTLRGYPAAAGGGAVRLDEPVTLNIAYSAGVADEELILAYWDDGWSRAGLTCGRAPGQNLLSCTAAAPLLTEFALFAPGPLYLPNVHR